MPLEWLPLLSSLLGGGGLIGSLVLLRKVRAESGKLSAEARKLNVETDGMLVARLYAEIDRLDREMASLRSRFDASTKASEAREAELERENLELRNKVTRLEQRIKAMETVLADVFKVDPNTADFTELLKQVDEAEAKMARKARR